MVKCLSSQALERQSHGKLLSSAPKTIGHQNTSTLPYLNTSALSQLCRRHRYMILCCASRLIPSTEAASLVLLLMLLLLMKITLILITP